MTDAIVTDIASLPPGTIIYLDALATYLHRHPQTIKRAVARGELPPPIRVLGCSAWIAESITNHLQQRQEQAIEKRGAVGRKLAVLTP